MKLVSLVKVCICSVICITMLNSLAFGQTHIGTVSIEGGNWHDGTLYEHMRYQADNNHYHSILSSFSSIYPYKNKMVFGVDRGHSSSPIDVLTLRGDGRVGIGTTNPGAKLEVSGDIYLSKGASRTIQVVQSSTGDGNNLTVMAGKGAEGQDYNGGNLILRGGDPGILSGKYSGGDVFIYGGDNSGGGGGNIFLAHTGSVPRGKVGIGTTSPGAKLDVAGTTRTKIIEITGGSDLAEQFEIAGTESVKPGMVVCIDQEQPGQLRVSSHPYDHTVAGIISGAGGLRPGILMTQTGSATDREFPVALTGRVYARADASNGPIRPGDLLTTSDTPGHIMKVTDHRHAMGAIIGKAMSALDEGQGLVLVLVALQ